MKRLFLLLPLTVILLIAASCNKTPRHLKWQDTVVSGLIPISCDQCFQPIIQPNINVFESLYAEAGISPIYTDEVEAIQLLMKDSVRLAVTARKLTDEEKVAFTNRRMVVRELVVAKDAVALIVNKDNNESFIGVPTLKKILTGEITDWNQLNPKSKLGKISVIFDNTNSSTVRYAMDSICGGQELSKNLYAQKNNNEVLEMVSKVPGALGVVGVGWIGNENDSTNLSFSGNIKVLAVSRFASPDQFNSFQPFQAYIALGQYPMTRDVYLLLSDPTTGLSTGFASFLTSDRGQRIILKTGLVPATQPINIVNVKDRMPN